MDGWTQRIQQPIWYHRIDVLCTAVTPNPTRKEDMHRYHISQSVLSLCAAAFVFVSKSQSYMNPDMTEFCHISSVGAFIAVYVHKCKYFSWNNQKSMELMQYYNPGFPVSLKPILKNCVLETYLFMVAPVYLIHTSCCVKPC